jgi:hypothetical protein
MEHVQVLGRIDLTPEEMNGWNGPLAKGFTPSIKDLNGETIIFRIENARAPWFWLELGIWKDKKKMANEPYCVGGLVGRNIAQLGCEFTLDPDEGTLFVRIQCENNPEFWLHVTIPLTLLKAAVL